MADLDEILKPENNVDYLYQPLPSIRDQQIRELIQSALEGRSLSSLASRITSHHTDALSVFSERMASLAVRQGNPALLVLGLVALVLAGLDSDSGDYETVQILPLHYRSAEKLGVSPWPDPC